MGTKTVTLKPTSINGGAAEFPVDVGSNGVRIRYDLNGINIAAFNSIRCTISGFSYQWYEEGYGYVQGAFYADLYNSAKQRVATIADSQYKEVYPRENTNFTIPFSASSNRQYSIYDGYYLEVELYCGASHYDAGGINSWLESNGITVTIDAQYDDLTIEEITPNPANVGDEVTVKFGNWRGQKTTLTLTANNRTIATFYVENSGSGSDEPIIEEPIIEEELIEESGVNNSSEGTYTFTCGTDWFTKAGATGNEFDITVTAVEDGALQRTAKSSFKLKREGIGTEITQQPISTGSNSLLKLKFNNRNGHELHLLIEGTAKGSSNRVKLVPSTSASYVTVSADTYTVTAADSWFNSINGSEMSVYITVTDAVDGRQDKLSAFTLKAGEALLPTISSITPYNISGNELLDNYGYVVGYSRIEIRVNGTTYSGTSVQSIIAKVGTEQITCSYNSTKQAYVGETSGTISSKSRITVTVTVTDSRGRVNTGYAYIEAQDITVLPNIGLTQQGTIYAEDSFYISPTGCIGDYYFIIKTANYTITTSQWRSEPTKVLTTYVRYFQNSNQAGLPSINLNITITDELGRSANFTFVMLAPLPRILSFAYTHVPDERMPPEDSSVQPTKADVVSGYSKINFTARVRWYCTPSSVVAKDQSNNVYTLSKTSNYSSESFPKEADYEFVSNDVIVTTYSQLIYTLTAKDAGVITSGAYRRTGEVLSSKITISIYRLQNLDLRLTSSSIVDTETQATFRVSNFVGSYDYAAIIVNDTVAENEEPETASTFGIMVDTKWFEGADSPTLDVEVTVKDVLGRERSVTFKARLNQFTLTLSPTGDITIGEDIQISVGGAGSQEVTIVLTTPLNGQSFELERTTATASSPATVTCLKKWFTDHAEFDSSHKLTVTVTASYAGRSVKQNFDLVYPDLGLAITKTVESQEVAVTSATVGENLNYTFSNLEGESVNVNYVYPAQNDRQLLQYGPYSTAQTIATPQLFDMANPPVTQSPSMQIKIVISDVRGREATVGNFTINASESMRPEVYDSEFEAINPPTVDSAFVNDYIGGITRLSATVKASSGSMAKVTEAILSIDGANVTMTPNGVDRNGKYVFTYVGSSPLQVEAIYDPRPVNLTAGFGLNSRGKVVENPQRAATIYPISARKNSTYTVEFKNTNDEYRVQCALWKGDVFDKVVTSAEHYTSVSFDTGDCDKVYVSLMRSNEASGTDQVDVEEANITIRMIDPFDMSVTLTPIPLNVTLKDERGLSDTMWIGTAFAHPYNAPNASIGYHRCNQDGTPNDSGGNCLLTCDFAFEGLWLNAFPPEVQNEGYVTVTTSNYEETKEFDFVKRKKSQFTLEAGYGLNASGEVVSNPLRAATVVPIERPSGGTGTPFFTVTFSGDYVVDYAGFNGTELDRTGTITSSGDGSIAPDIEDLYISLRRANETAESDPVDIAEANVQVTWNLGNSEDGSFEFLIPNMSIEQTYKINITLTDLITSTSYTVTLSTGYAIMDFYHGGKGVAIGKVAEDENLLEVNPNWELKASVKINGQLYDLATLLSQIKQQLGI